MNAHYFKTRKGTFTSGYSSDLSMYGLLALSMDRCFMLQGGARVLLSFVFRSFLYH